jgi:hypothetical protein
MVNTAPVIGRNAHIKMNNVVVGYGKNFTIGIRKGIIKEYMFQSTDPGLLETGNCEYPWTCELMWIDSVYAALVLDGTKITIEVGPEGSTPVGSTKITLSNAILNTWNLNIKQDGVVLENISGEGKTLAFTTY